MLQYLSRAYKRQQIGITDFWPAFFPTSPFLIMVLREISWTNFIFHRNPTVSFPICKLIFPFWELLLSVEHNHFQWVPPISPRHEVLLVDATALPGYHHLCWVYICCFTVPLRPLQIVAVSPTFWCVPAILMDCNVHQIPQSPLGPIANIIKYYWSPRDFTSGQSSINIPYSFCILFGYQILKVMIPCTLNGLKKL